ncbi:MAG: caspase family protein [Synechococcales cyanobacterium M58_A2018_015]|nr:caspase family protein [Synechococcales cyanobacterium M58_A2018_015]
MSRDALVVGINTYQYLPSLQAPARDAEAVAQQLQRYGEFRVHRLPEVIQEGNPRIGQKTLVTLRELETGLINLFKPKGSAVPHTALFYFSGHGLQREAGIHEGYLALGDSNPDQGFYGLSLFWLRRLLQESPVRQRIILLDCCHSGELLNFLEADPGAYPGTDRLFMAASRDYETAYESLDGSYSVFTQALLTGLDPNRLDSGVVTNHSLTDWVNHSLKGEIQQPLFESSGSEIILTRRSAGATDSNTRSGPSVVHSKDVCPYRGLEFFDEAHSDYFFGREDLTHRLIDLLHSQPFVAVVGASGSGKTSLIRAGLIAQLRQGKKLPGSENWRIKLLTPTEHPLKSLAAAFIDSELSELERAEQLRRAEVFLQDKGAGLAQLVRASLSVESSSTTRSPHQTHPRLLLVIDQFEEVFTLAEGSQSERERQEFLQCLLEALSLAEDCLSIVLVLRADFLNKCSLYPDLIQQIERHQVMVPPLKYEQIKATIVRPAQKVGLVCEPNLVYTMMSDVIGAPGELPLLQYTLLELWRRRRMGSEGGVARLALDAYQELGGVRGTLQKRATEVFYSLTAEEQLVAKRIFLALTQLGEGTEDTRRRVMKSELVSPRFPIELVERVLEKLVAAKLVVTSQEIVTRGAAVRSNPNPEPSQISQEHSEADSGIACDSSSEQPVSSSWWSHEIVDVTHEALIRNWPLLREWLDESREMLRRQRRIEQAAQEWISAGQPATGEYLLHGLRLRDAEDFLKIYPQELSAVAQTYINISCAEMRRARRESRQLRIVIPSLLVAMLAVVLSQYHTVIQSQAKKDDQLQAAAVRERAAIAQSILQDPQADPMAALLIGRLAAEDPTASHEAQSSLRAALQELRLQLNLQGHQAAVPHIVFSSDRQSLATASLDGTIRLWTVNPQTIYNTRLSPARVLSWSAEQRSSSAIHGLHFSPNGQQVLAIAADSPLVKIWSVQSGEVVQQLAGSAAVIQASYSPTGDWIATTHADGSLALWRAATGELQIRLPQSRVSTSLQFSADGQTLLTAAEDGIVQLWRLQPTPTATLEPAATFSHGEPLRAARFGPQGRSIATLGQSGTVKLWKTENGQPLSILSPPLPNLEKPTPPDPAFVLPLPQLPGIASVPSRLDQIEFSPDEQRLAALDTAQQVWIWNLTTGQIEAALSPPLRSSLPSAQAPPRSASQRLRFSPDGRLLAVGDLQPSQASQSSVVLWDWRAGRQIGRLSGHRGVASMQFSPDGTYVVTGDETGSVRLWTAERGGELPTLNLPETSVQWAMFLPGETRTATAAVAQSTAAAEPSSPIEQSQPDSSPATPLLSGLRPLNGLALLPLFPPQPIHTVRPSATPSRDAGSVAASDRPTTMQTMPLSQSESAFNTLRDTSSKASQEASPNLSQEVVQETSSGTSETSTDLLASVTTMVTLTPEGTLQRWQILTGRPSESTLLLPSTITPVAAIQDYPSAAQVWRFLAAALPEQLRLIQPDAVPQPAKSGLAAMARQVAGDQLTPLPSSTKLLDQLGISQEAAALSSVALSPTGRYVAIANIEGWVEFYRLSGQQPPRLLHRLRNWRWQEGLHRLDTQETPNSLSSQGSPKAGGDPTAIRHLSFSPNGQQVLGIADDLTVRLWDVQSGQLVQVLQGHEATIRQARYSPDGRWIITASWDRTARLWQTETGKLHQVLRHSDAVSSASLSSDQQRMVTTSWDGSVRLWQLGSTEPPVLLKGHAKAVLDAQFSPNGQLLVTASADGTAYLWDGRTGEQQAQLRPHRSDEPAEAMLQAFFSPDGHYVATLTKSGRIHLWAATREMLLKLARDRSLRQLTLDECSQYLRLSPEQCPTLPQ